MRFYNFTKDLIKFYWEIIRNRRFIMAPFETPSLSCEWGCEEISFLLPSLRYVISLDIHHNEIIIFIFLISPFISNQVIKAIFNDANQPLRVTVQTSILDTFINHPFHFPVPPSTWSTSCREVDLHLMHCLFNYPTTFKYKQRLLLSQSYYLPLNKKWNTWLVLQL